ncbi:MAG: CBS domain-containing protein [Elusimicrobiota bacterium]
MKVNEVMTKSPAFCTAETGLQEVAKMMCDRDCGEIPVLENKLSLKPVGVITDRDIVCRTVAQGKNPADLQASDCMTSPAITIRADLDIDECCDVLESKRIRRVLVVDEKGRCSGIVSQADIARKCGVAKAGEVVREVSLAA